MSDFILGHNDIGYTSSFAISGSNSWATGLDETMLTRKFITAVARTTGVQDLTIDITFTIAQDTEVLGLVNHNLSPTGTYQWIAYTNSSRTTSVYDSTAITVGNYFSKMEYKTCCTATGSPVSSTHWRLIISDPSNLNGYFEIGRIFMGERLYFNRNMDYGLQFSVRENNSGVSESQNGIETFIVSGKKRSAMFSFNLLNYDDGNEYLKFIMSNGITGACLFEFNPEDRQDGLKTFICRQESINPLEHPYNNINNISLNLVEIF